MCTGAGGVDVGALLDGVVGDVELSESPVHEVSAAVSATTARPAPNTRVTADLTARPPLRLHPLPPFPIGPSAGATL
jgi:hypothetical protein